VKKWKEINQISLEKKIAKLRTGGGTSISPAMETARGMYAKKNMEGVNRVFFFTDLEVSSTDGHNFASQVEEYSNSSGVFSTVVGVGLDLSSDVIERVSKTSGCNYANVRTTETFRELVREEFNYMVTPIGFNIRVKIENMDCWSFDEGFGTFEVKKIDDKKCVRFATLFPSRQNKEGESRSGIIVLKLKNAKADQPIKLKYVVLIYLHVVNCLF